MAVENGDKIKVEYEGKLEDGEVFDSSANHGQPLEFIVGKGMLIKGFDNAVIGMEVGDEKEITLPPAEAYGEPNPAMVQKIPRDKLPQDQDPKEGMMLMIATPQGQQFPAKIAGVDEKEITVDLNHPLAGKTLIFKIKVVDRTPAAEVKDEPSGCEHCHDESCESCGDASLEDAVGGSEEESDSEEKSEAEEKSDEEPAEEPEEKTEEEKKE